VDATPNTKVRDCVRPGYYVHSSGKVDSYWLDLQRLRSILVDQIDVVADEVVAILADLAPGDDLDTVFYFRNEVFGIDVPLDLADFLKTAVRRKMGGDRLHHSLLDKYEDEHGPTTYHLRLEDPYGYRAVVVFGTSFHTPSIIEVVKALERRRVSLLGAIFLVMRSADDVVSKIQPVPCRSLLTLDHGQLSGNGLLDERAIRS
jgi:hypothetical protein